MKARLFRFAVFWVWTLTLTISIGVFLAKMIHEKMTFREIEAPLTNIVALLLPQISIMVAFFFRISKERQAKLLRVEHGLAKLAVSLSLFYHAAFWAILLLGVGMEVFGRTIDDNTNATMKIMGFLSVFGLSPVAYLFASGHDTSD